MDSYSIIDKTCKKPLQYVASFKDNKQLVHLYVSDPDKVDLEVNHPGILQVVDQF